MKHPDLQSSGNYAVFNMGNVSHCPFHGLISLEMKLRFNRDDSSYLVLFVSISCLLIRSMKAAAQLGSVGTIWLLSFSAVSSCSVVTSDALNTVSTGTVKLVDGVISFLLVVALPSGSYCSVASWITL